VPQTYVSLGGAATSNPAVAVSGSQLFVFVRGTTNALFVQRFSGLTPPGWENLGGYVTSNPVAASDSFGGNGVTVVVRGSDMSEFRQHLPTAGSGTGWISMGGYVTSNAGVATNGTSVYVFVRGSDNSLFYQQLNSAVTPASWIALGGVGTSDPLAAYDGSNVRVVVRSADNGYYWLTPGGGWAALGGNYTGNPAITSSP
jgi:hypothetical protein